VRRQQLTPEASVLGRCRNPALSNARTPMVPADHPTVLDWRVRVDGPSPPAVSSVPGLCRTRCSVSHSATCRRRSRSRRSHPHDATSSCRPRACWSGLGSCGRATSKSLRRRTAGAMTLLSLCSSTGYWRPVPYPLGRLHPQPEPPPYPPFGVPRSPRWCVQMWRILRLGMH
jgi:hypothetical protein